MYLLGLLLSNLISKLFGKFANTKFPFFIQKYINRFYISIFSIDLTDFSPVETYPTLCSLFTRAYHLTPTFDSDPSVMISPCDSTIIECGDITGLKILQIKGISYNLQDLLGPYFNALSCQNGQFINFYLSPKDYHRYHAPCDLHVKSATYIPGMLYPVNIPTLKKIPSLYTQNERVVLECLTANNQLFYLIYVGALNVGSIKFIFDDQITTNTNSKQPSFTRYENIIFHKGAEMGRFEMGSTIVLVAPTGMLNLLIKQGMNIKYGMIIGKINQDTFDLL